jgi:DNA-binding transcriptional regulator YiaG
MMILEVKEMTKDAVGEKPQLAETATHEIEDHAADEPPLSEPPLGETGMYAQIVSHLREQALTTQELADVIGVNSRQVSNWASGHNVPRGDRRERLLEIDYIVKQLRGIYTREGTEIWLHGRKRSLGHQRPIDLMREGRFQTVLNAIERLNAGAM